MQLAALSHSLIGGELCQDLMEQDLGDWDREQEEGGASALPYGQAFAPTHQEHPIL